MVPVSAHPDPGLWCHVNFLSKKTLSHFLSRWAPEDTALALSLLLRMSRFFLSKKDSLTLSQLVSPRRHCAGSLQAFYDKRLKEGNIKTQNSKHHYNNIYRNRGNQLWHYFFGQVQLRRRPPVLVETVYKQTWGETTDLSLKFSHVELFHGEFQAPGEVMVDAYRH